MVLLAAKINKLYSKLDNHNNLHHHHNQSLDGFFSDVLDDLNNKLSPKVMSFSSIHTFFDLISITHKAFAKLVVSIDHPMSKWIFELVDQYLKYTATLLELFNSISSSLSHLSHTKLTLSHGLSLNQEKHLKPIEPFGLACKTSIGERKFDEELKGPSSEEAIIYRALMVMESLGLWVCGIVLPSLSGRENTRFGGDDFGFSSLIGGRLDSSVVKAMIEKKVEMVKEVTDVNESVARLVAAISDGDVADEGEELRKRLKALERELDGFGSKVNCLFNEVLRSRNELLNAFQVHKRKE